MSTPLDPQNVICVVTKDGKEVGRVAAAAPNASAYLTEMARQHGGCKVDYVEDPDAAAASRMLFGNLRLFRAPL